MRLNLLDIACASQNHYSLNTSHLKTVAAEKSLLAENPSLLEFNSKADIGRWIALGAMDACNASDKGMVV